MEGTVILQKGNPDGFDKMPKWQQQQYKSFRGWLIYNLAGKDIVGLTQALHDGTLLVELIEKLTGEKLKGIEKRPRMRIQIINNVGQVFKYLLNIPLVINNISPEDIVDGNVKLTLGFLWILILHFHIKNEPVEEPSDDISLSPAKPATAQKTDAKVVLVDKVNEFFELQGLPFKVTNFTDEWQDGMRFGALIHACDENFPPNWSEFKPENARQNLEVCFDILKNDFGLPEILSVEDMMDQKPDEKSVMTFIAMILHAFQKKNPIDEEAAKQRREERKKKEEEERLRREEEERLRKEEEARKKKEKEEEERLRREEEERKKKEKEEEERRRREEEERLRKEEEARKKKEKEEEERLRREEEERKRKEAEEEEKRKQKEEEEKRKRKEQERLLLEEEERRRKEEKRKQKEEEERKRKEEEEKRKEEEKIKREEEERRRRAEEEEAARKKKEKEEEARKKKEEEERRRAEEEEARRRAEEEEAERKRQEESKKKKKKKKKKKVPKGEKVDLRVCACRRLKPYKEVDDDSANPDPFVKISAVGKKEEKERETDVIEKSLYPEWNAEYEFERGELQLDDTLELRVKDKSKGKDLGVVHVPIKDVADATERDQVYDEWLPLLNPKTDERVDGDIRIVATYGGIPLPAVTKYLPIKIRVGEGRELLGVDSEGLSDPYCVLEVPGHKMKKNRTKTSRMTVNPEWDDEFFFDSGVVDAAEEVLTVRLFTDKGKEQIPLGVVQFPFKQCLEAPYIDDWFPVMRHDKPDKQGSGDIHLVVTYGRDLPPVLTPQFLIAVLAGRNLASGNLNGLSDPYVQVWVPGKKARRLVLKTKTQKKTINPVWNQEFEFEMDDFDKEKDIIEFHIYDRDFIGENKPLGIVELALKDIIKVPYIDSWFTVYDHKHPSKKGTGELHLRIAFGKNDKKRFEEAFGKESRPSSIGPPATRFRVSKDIIEKKKVKARDRRFGAAKGLPIRVRIVAASSLKGSPDPAVTVEIPDKKTTQKLKTKAQKKTGNPVWNEEFHMAGEPLDEDDNIRFSVNSGFSFIGQAEVRVRDIMNADDGIYTGMLPLLNSKGEDDKARGILHVLIAFGDAKLPEIQVTLTTSGGARSRSGTLPTIPNLKNADKRKASADDVILQHSSSREDNEPAPSSRKSRRKSALLDHRALRKNTGDK